MNLQEEKDLGKWFLRDYVFLKEKEAERNNTMK